MGGRHAFVEFTTQGAVAEALKLHKKDLKDKPVKVRVTQSEAFSQNSRARTVLTVPSLPFCRSLPSVQIIRDSGPASEDTCIRRVLASETVIMTLGIRGAGMVIEVTGAPTDIIKQALNLSSYRDTAG